MSTSYQVETGDVAISDALLKSAAENGWKGDRNLVGQHRAWLVLNTTDGLGAYAWNIQGYPRHETLTIPEFLALLRKGPPTPKEPPIVIGSVEVQFRTDGIIIPCCYIDTATVDAIHTRLHANDKRDD